MGKQILKLLGSLKLAVVLLVALTVILASATFYESAESSRAAAINVYRTWWFNGLLALLAANIGAAALTRWPWKKKHVGFVITHAGLIVLLGGCSAAFHYGTEGMMEMHVGAPPNSIVRVDDEALTVVVPETGQRVKSVVRVRKSGAISPSAIKVSDNLRLTLDESVPNTTVETVVRDGGEKPNPALRFRLESDLAQQHVGDWLLALSPERSRASFGPAQIEFVVAGDAEELKRLTTAPDKGADATKPTLVVHVGGTDWKFEIPANMDKQLKLGESGVNAQITGYWPDFKLDENHKPSTVSQEPNNPAAVVIFSRGTEDEQRAFIFADPQMPPIVRTTRGQPIDAEARLVVAKPKPKGSQMTVVLGPDQKLHYAAVAKDGFKSGELKVGETIEPGWMDFRFTVEAFATNAVVSARIARAPVDPEGGFPAIVVTAHLGSEKKTEWVRFGQPAVIEVGGKAVHVMYSWDTMRLPFTVTLEDFIVDRDEGSQDVASWTSKVLFRDDERGTTQRASIWMNNPGWFNGYKFSQASWNPNDLKYSALQVKKDPRWVTYVTWTGAVLIVGGIALMFWGRGWLQRKGEGGRMREEERKKEMVTA